MTEQPTFSFVCLACARRGGCHCSACEFAEAALWFADEQEALS
jgi:hypothetical protein